MLLLFCSGCLFIYFANPFSALRMQKSIESLKQKIYNIYVVLPL